MYGTHGVAGPQEKSCSIPRPTITLNFPVKCWRLSVTLVLELLSEYRETLKPLEIYIPKYKNTWIFWQKNNR